MFTLELNARQCLCCGICMDVCRPGALRMRTWRGRTVEGPRLPGEANGQSGEVRAAPMTFPYLAHPERCDGCGECVAQCPVTVLTLAARAVFTSE